MCLLPFFCLDSLLRLLHLKYFCDLRGRKEEEEEKQVGLFCSAPM